MPTIPPAVTAPPALTPQRNDRTTFSARMDVFITWFVAVIAQLVALVTNCYNNAVSSYDSASAAAASAANAAATANVSAWVSGTNYVAGDCRWSPLDFLTYRRKTNGAGAVDPSADAVNWGLLFSGYANFAGRNRFINGDMSVAQLNGATAVTPGAGTSYPIDQWRVDLTAASKLSFQQVVDAPAGFKYSEKITVVAQYAPAATDRMQFQQPIEGQNIIDIGPGTAAPATIAVSVWVKGSVAGTYACGIFNDATARSYVGLINVTAGWSKQTVVLTHDNTGVWSTDNGSGTWFGIDLGSGANYNAAAAGAWAAGYFLRTAGSVTFVNQVAGATLNITGAQFEKVPTGATVGTYFEFLPNAEQLRRCQRYLPYFSNTSGIGSIFGMGAVIYDTASIFCSIALPVSTRIPVTGLVTVANTAYTIRTGTINRTPFAAPTLAASSNVVAEIVIVDSGITFPAPVRITWSNGSYLYFTGAQL